MVYITEFQWSGEFADWKWCEENSKSSENGGNKILIQRVSCPQGAMQIFPQIEVNFCSSQ